MQRRSFLRLTFSGVAAATIGMPVGACGGEPAAELQTTTEPDRGARGRGRVLLAYFSRPGENYWNGGRRDLEVGDTEPLARLIRARLACDVHRIRERDPYPEDYEATVAPNVRETERRCPAADRQPPEVDRRVPDDPPGEPDLERPGADDHVDLR